MPPTYGFTGTARSPEPVRNAVASPLTLQALPLLLLPPTDWIHLSISSACIWVEPDIS